MYKRTSPRGMAILKIKIKDNTSIFNKPLISYYDL